VTFTRHGRPGLHNDTNGETIVQAVHGNKLPSLRTSGS
jgi:hypothetical protein